MPKGPPPRTVEARFWPKVRKRAGNQCWEWMACTHDAGYGLVSAGGKHGAMLFAHRVSYEIHHGPIPDGMHICHKCDNPPCVNPDHLFLGTRSDNMLDMVKKDRSGCAILDYKTADKIRERHAAALVGRKRVPRGFLELLCAEYGVAKPTIGNLIRKETW